MAFSGVSGGIEIDLLFDIKEEVQNIIFDCDFLECKGVPCYSWTNKCVYLHNDNGILVAEGICHSDKSNLMVGSIGLLGNTPVASQISKSLKANEFLEDWKYTV